METLNSSANVLSPDCYMVTDAYYHIPIHHDQQKYLKVAVQMSPRVAHFQYRALPFGIAIAPRVFTKVVAHVRKESGVFVPYLDDFLQIGETLQDVQRQCDRTLKFWTHRGGS